MSGLFQDIMRARCVLSGEWPAVRPNPLSDTPGRVATRTGAGHVRNCRVGKWRQGSQTLGLSQRLSVAFYPAVRLPYSAEILLGSHPLLA